MRGVKCMGLAESKRPVVLIVEDEFLLRMHAAEMIEAAGFEAVEASNADEAIDVLESRRDITVVFTDIQMPGSMDGLKLARGFAAAGRQSRSSQPRAGRTSANWICRKAAGFWRNPMVRCSLQVCCGS